MADSVDSNHNLASDFLMKVWLMDFDLAGPLKVSGSRAVAVHRPLRFTRLDIAVFVHYCNNPATLWVSMQKMSR